MTGTKLYSEREVVERERAAFLLSRASPGYGCKLMETTGECARCAHEAAQAFPLPAEVESPQSAPTSRSKKRAS